jgi:hypothetical protein
MRVVSRTNVSNEDLLKLQKDIEDLGAHDVRRHAVETELASYCDAYASVSEGRIALRSAFGESGPRAGQKGTLLDKSEPYIERGLGWFLRGFVKLDEAAMIKGYVAFLDNLDDPGIGSMKVGDAIAEIIGKKRPSFARLAASALSRQVSYTWRLRAQAEAAAAALAVLRYRNDTGKWPETLDALVPAYLAKVPVERFNQQPFVYTILLDGIMVYSVGGNGIDDGGKPHLVAPAPNDNAPYDDIGIRIWK